MLLYRHALQLKDRLSLNEVEMFDAQTDRTTWLLNAMVAFVSILLALLLPDGLIPVAGMWYAVLGIVMPWHMTRRERRRPSLAD